MSIKFVSVLILYMIFTAVALVLSLSPLTLYLYAIMTTNNLWLYLSLPLGAAALWLLGFLFFVLLHARIVVRLTLPSIKPGRYPILSDQNKIYALRLSADNMAKYWAKSLEWIPFIAQMFLYRFMLKQYGVKIGKGVYIATETRIDAVPLIEIGDNCFIAPRAIIGAHIVHRGGDVLYKEVKIGKKCFIGHSSVLTPGAQVGDEVILGAMTIALLDTVIPAKETWIGMPARPIQKVKEEILPEIPP